MDLRQSLNDVAFLIQRELQYSKGYISQDPEVRRLQIEWSLKLLQIQELQDISCELENISSELRKLPL